MRTRLFFCFITMLCLVPGLVQSQEPKPQYTYVKVSDLSLGSPYKVLARGADGKVIHIYTREGFRFNTTNGRCRKLSAKGNTLRLIETGTVVEAYLKTVLAANRDHWLGLRNGTPYRMGAYSAADFDLVVAPPQAGPSVAMEKETFNTYNGSELEVVRRSGLLNSGYKLMQFYNGDQATFFKIRFESTRAYLNRLIIAGKQAGKKIAIAVSLLKGGVLPADYERNIEKYVMLSNEVQNFNPVEELSRTATVCDSADGKL